MNCKIIDIHTHIYPVALARRAMEVTGQEHDDFKNLPIRENLLTRMQDAGVTLSVNLPVVSKPQNQAEVNRFAKESARKTSFRSADFIRTVKMWRRSWKN